MPFRLLARAFLPPFVFIFARKPDFLAFLILLLRAVSIVYSIPKRALQDVRPAFLRVCAERRRGNDSRMYQFVQA
jgi:hypothetical protein